MSPILWIILGGLVGVGFYLTLQKYTLTWYEWVLVVLGVILILFSFQNFAAFGVEAESRAATFSLLIFGLPGLILVGVAFFLARSKAKA